MFAGKKLAQIREILISESTWEEMTCLFAPSLAVLIFTLTFLAEIIFSFPLLVVRISLQELQLELMVEYALFFSVMAGIGWQFSRRTPPG
ncbi:membrane protein [Escherichia coli]|nr:membrane protein [Escherichia coli]